MRKKLFEFAGIAYLDMILLLDVKQKDEFKDWRSLILSELESFVAGTTSPHQIPINSLPHNPDFQRP